MTPQELAESIRLPMFADRGTDLRAAMEYADQVISRTDMPSASYTALFVVLNTIANILDARTE